MDANDNPNKLAEVVRRALTDTRFRLALETGTLSATDLRLSPIELDAVSEVMRRYKGATTKKVLPEIVAWRTDD